MPHYYERNIVEINAWRIQNLQKVTVEVKEEAKEQEEISEGETQPPDDDLPF